MYFTHQPLYSAPTPKWLHNCFPHDCQPFRITAPAKANTGKPKAFVKKKKQAMFTQCFQQLLQVKKFITTTKRKAHILVTLYSKHDLPLVWRGPYFTAQVSVLTLLWDIMGTICHKGQTAAEIATAWGVRFIAVIGIWSQVHMCFRNGSSFTQRSTAP